MADTKSSSGPGQTLLRTVPLTRAACEALQEEARRDLENSIGERFGFREREEGRKQEKRILACADVLGAIGSVNGAFVLRPESTATVSVGLTGDAIDWLREVHRGTRGHIDELEKTGEGDRTYCANEAYLERILGRVLQECGEEVTD